MRLPTLNISPAARISIGLVALILAWLLMMDILVGIWPDQQNMVKDLRQKTSENLAIQSAVLMQSGDVTSLKKTLDEALKRDNSIYSIAIRKQEGRIVLQAGNHKQYWQPVHAQKSTLDFVRVELSSGKQVWGNLEIAFKPAAPQTFLDWLKQPAVIAIALLVLGGFALYSFYLGKVFSYLDPSSVIPDRVRLAYDAFSEGVMMVDKEGRIVLVNKVLREWSEENNSKLFGKQGKDIAWLKSAFKGEANSYPWIKSMEMQESISGWQAEFQKPNGQIIKTIVNCAPIQDANHQIRGCLTTFDNVTEIDRVNKELLQTMVELNKTKEEVENQNKELIKLATRDPMTNCMNRRAFFENADVIFAEFVKSKQPLSCIMTDIDHFKQFNDKYGHAVGDKVIIAVSRNLFSGLRAEDLLCRYGGEEFCILLQNAPESLAMTIAERLRSEIESNAGSAIRSTQDIHITSSFGVSTLSEHTPDLAVLIEQADQALYASKHAGRNKVSAWRPSI